MRRVVDFFLKNMFVAGVAAAAWLHSAWVFSTSFGGNPPGGEWWQVVIWYVPGGLLAFALDIGLLATSLKLRHKRTAARMFTFFSLSAFQFYLQWLYLAQHVPPVILSEGVRAEWRPLMQMFGDARIVVVPLLLPLALILYTASTDDDKPAARPVTERGVQSQASEISEAAIAAIPLGSNTPAPQVAAADFLPLRSGNGHEPSPVSEP